MCGTFSPKTLGIFDLKTAYIITKSMLFRIKQFLFNYSCYNVKLYFKDIIPTKKRKVYLCTMKVYYALDKLNFNDIR